MEYISYTDALNFWNTPNNKIKVVIFALEDCATCDDFIPDIFEKMIIDEFSDHFDMVKVSLDDESISFPPLGLPTVYFYIPNTDEPMPLIRTGGAPEQMIRKDLQNMVKMKDENFSIEEAFADTHYMEISPWIQRQIRF